MNRAEIAELIVNKINEQQSELASMYARTKATIGYFVVDNLLSVEIATKIFKCFPPNGDMRLRKSLREFKYSAAQMNNYDPILEETVYAFQDPRVVKLIATICQIQSNLYPDEHLYAGGISLMGNKHFLNPHLDNSHDKDRSKWRVLNLLYYVTPDWPVDRGGNLELWCNGLDKSPTTVHSKFNRLAVMATHDTSWHSVSPISFSGHPRCCVSNYYFSDDPLKKAEAFHVTSFRGRPEQKLRDLVLKADGALRMGLRKVFKKGVVETKHVYKR